jgi:Domain of unknown function (DUF4214)
MGYTFKAYGENNLWNLRAWVDSNPLSLDEIRVVSRGAKLVELEVAFGSDTFRVVATGDFQYQEPVLTAAQVSGKLLTASIQKNGQPHEYSSYAAPVELSQWINSSYSDHMAWITGNDLFVGSGTVAKDDEIQGGTGNDTFIGYGSGQWGDKFYGGEGIDTAVFRGNRADYQIEFLTDMWDGRIEGGGRVEGFKITDRRENRDGIDYLSGVERLRFSDGNLALDIEKGENAGAVYRLYEAAFNRAPKPVGEGYWLKKMDSGETLTQIAAQFIQTEEFRSIYGENPTPVNYVYKLFNNILGRDPKAAGLNYYLDMLEKKTMADVLAHISESDENILNTAPLIANGIPYQEIL